MNISGSIDYAQINLNGKIIDIFLDKVKNKDEYILSKFHNTSTLDELKNKTEWINIFQM